MWTYHQGDAHAGKPIWYFCTAEGVQLILQHMHAFPFGILMGLPLSEHQRSHKPLMHGLTARTISSLVSGFLSLLGGGGASGALGFSSCCCCARTVSRAAAGRPAERPTRWEPTQATLLADAVEHTRDPLRTSIPIFSYRDTVSRSKIDRLFAVLYSHHQLLPHFPRSIRSKDYRASHQRGPVGASHASPPNRRPSSGRDPWDLGARPSLLPPLAAQPGGSAPAWGGTDRHSS